jgi:hypothetical protein
MEHLSGLPETGMGYQIVEVELRNGERIRDVMVFNAEEVEWPGESAPFGPEDIVGIRTTAR